MAAESAIAALLAGIDSYLARFEHEGVAEVRRGLATWGQGALTEMTPLETAACQHLDAALAAATPPELAAAIAAARPFLRWGGYDAYPLEDIGAAFAGGHAFASLIGDGGFHAAEDFDLGLFVIAPDIFYRDHHHAAPELYAPLTGPHGWRFKPGDQLQWKPAHEPIWNAPWAPHATMTGAVPFLCIYCWTRDADALARVIPSNDWPQLEQRA
ncbi:MAG: dimethylsulfoniopropionate lyase [Proteobacteria bacterium]|nr:dimethylsulfoniopropionate lyase [Pseudomonadota bacterium]